MLKVRCSQSAETYLVNSALYRLLTLLEGTYASWKKVRPRNMSKPVVSLGLRFSGK
jgi:hypothetical protein